MIKLILCDYMSLYNVTIRSLMQKTSGILENEGRKKQIVMCSPIESFISIVKRFKKTVLSINS